MKDPFEILGVNVDASEEEIKSAYKALAKKYHPDVNKEKGSEDKFKEISQAYQSIVDGSYAKQGHQDDVFRTQQDIMEHFMKQAHRMRRSSIQPNLDVEIAIEFLDACYGAEKNIRYTFMDICEKCETHKQKHGDYKHKKCDACNGTGRLTFRNGNMQVQTTCSQCMATGKIIDCHDCGGTFFIRREAELNIKIPAGIDNGMALRAAGRGNTLGQKEKYGDLFIHVMVKPHAVYQRESLHIYSQIQVDYIDCILGNTVKAQTIWGLADVSIPECSNATTVVCIKGFGIDHKGDHFFRLAVDFPKSIDAKERKILGSLNTYKKKKKN